MDPLKGASNIIPDSLASPPLELEIVSVDDSEAFAAKHLSDLGIPVDDFKKHSWRITNYCNLAKRVTSDTFTAGGHEWNILLFPQGASNGQANSMVSIYLNYFDPDKQPEGWHVSVVIDHVCGVSLIHFDLSLPEAQHRFTHDAQNFGFSEFVELQEVLGPADSRVKPIIENEETIITAYVRILKDETGVLWHNFANYDSKKATGYVGLKNPGATCYLNSVLQSLSLTNYFRKAIYQIPTEHNSPNSVLLALQHVFYQLQTSNQPVETTKLTKSLGWKARNAFLQHDVQEFLRVLLDKLERRLEGSPAEGIIQSLFAGKYKTYIKCMNGHYKTSQEEMFLDIQLDIKDLQGKPFKTLQESLQAYITPETMDGENKYDAGADHGLQVAQKGVIFLEFPAVLHLHLKWFDYHLPTHKQVKINNQHEFPFELNLAPYLDESANKSLNWNYLLHSVFVHSGDVHRGHYFVLVKPDPKSKWYKFDDGRVTPVTDQEVFEENFGGKLITNGPLVSAGGEGDTKNAYVLAYVRESAVADPLAPITQADTPNHLMHDPKKRGEQAAKKKREKEEIHPEITVKIITDETFRLHDGLDLALFDDDRKMLPSRLPMFSVAREQPFQEFKSNLAHNLGYQPNKIRLWVLINRKDETVRPEAVVPEDDPKLTMETVCVNMALKAPDLKLYLEVLDPAPQAPPVESKERLMIFLKYFDVMAQSSAGVGHFYVHPDQKVGDIIPLVNKRMNFAENQPLKLYEEIKHGLIVPMQHKETFEKRKTRNGDIICFQIKLPDSILASMHTKRFYLNPVGFYDHFTKWVSGQFEPRDGNVATTSEISKDEHAAGTSVLKENLNKSNKFHGPKRHQPPPKYSSLAEKRLAKRKRGSARDSEKDYHHILVSLPTKENPGRRPFMRLPIPGPKTAQKVQTPGNIPHFLLETHSFENPQTEVFYHLFQIIQTFFKMALNRNPLTKDPNMLGGSMRGIGFQQGCDEGKLGGELFLFFLSLDSWLHQ
ncbi:hypothetical protein PtB15_15B136 [Puccinia triticina]|nr:hypothetical protein PtB15_15B136 [Puccinia triticina]